MVAQPPVSRAAVPGTELLDPRWLEDRISEMGISWGTGDARVSGTLWWCMAASSLIAPIVEAFATGSAAMDPALEHIACEIRPDGGIERVFPVPGIGEFDDLEMAGSILGDIAADVTVGEWAGAGERPSTPGAGAGPGADSCCGAAPDEHGCSIGHRLRVSLSRVIPVVAQVSGASVPSLWAIVADAIGNRALDAGDQDAAARLAHEVAGRLPVPRFSDIGSRTFVRRISCCLVFEVPGSEMCTSCPKRPAAQREKLLYELATRG